MIFVAEIKIISKKPSLDGQINLSLMCGTAQTLRSISIKLAITLHPDAFLHHV